MSLRYSLLQRISVRFDGLHSSLVVGLVSVILFSGKTQSSRFSVHFVTALVATCNPGGYSLGTVWE